MEQTADGPPIDDFTMQNRLIQLLSDKTSFCGSTLMCGSTRVTEVLARSNFDVLMVDLQHEEFSKASATDSIRAIAASRTIPIGRLADNHAWRDQ
jgi:2-keto-3-deoxy-L-rhamnonate aldolase RhmA